MRIDAAPTFGRRIGAAPGELATPLPSAKGSFEHLSPLRASAISTKGGSGSWSRTGCLLATHHRRPPDLTRPTFTAHTRRAMIEVNPAGSFAQIVQALLHLFVDRLTRFDFDGTKRS